MGMFDKVSQDEFNKYKDAMQLEIRRLNIEFDSYKKIMGEKLVSLQSKIEENATVSDEVARAAAVGAEKSQSNIKLIENEFSGALEELNRLKSDAEKDFLSISEVNDRAVSAKEELDKIILDANEDFLDFSAKKSVIDTSSATISEKVEEFNDYLEQSKDLPNSLDATKVVLDECKKLTDSIQGLLNHSLKKKAEIDDLHKEIYGEDISNSQGDIEHTLGLKDELDGSYVDLQKNVTSLEGVVKKTIGDASTKFDEFLKFKLNEFHVFLKKSESRFEAVDNQLTGLLPGGMAAGLSAAYEEKKNDEIASLKSFDFSFRLAIVGMVAVSVIPLGIDLYLLIGKGMDLVKIIRDTPTIILAILPLYFPVLWLAYSSNKKSNLSKRLIEEYTHKSVLGKTFSGLSNQIETLQHIGAVKDELRTKLLFNILQVSAENPGKLITNYSKSDHPLMDAIENSAKLADSVSALSKIPGFSIIANKLAKKTDDLLRENTKKIRDGLETQEVLDEDELELEEKEEKEEKDEK